MRILLTGAAGFIGGHIGATLTPRSYDHAVAGRKWTERSPSERRRSYLTFAGLYLVAFVVALVLGWTIPAVVLAVIGILLTLLGLWNPDPTDGESAADRRYVRQSRHRRSGNGAVSLSGP